ncbi:MAG: arsenite methyltransferase [Candidatus Hodarchaeales archaeon]
MTKENIVKLEEKRTTSYSCCQEGSNEAKDNSHDPNESNIEDIHIKVRKQYAKIASSSDIELETGSGQATKASDTYTDYSKDELSSLPKGANLGLGSGNPVALANIQKGETVVDLGSGAGIDCFLAAKEVGESGKVIGIDMTPEMIDKARDNARKGVYHNVEFRLGEIEHLPIADNSVDVIISNCVINLSPEKSKVFKETYRVLRPGGRILISDMVLNYEFPEAVKKALNMPGCVSSAWVKEDYLNVIKKAGFERVELLEAELIKPRYQPKTVETASGLIKVKLGSYDKEIEVELTPEEVNRLSNTVMKAHIRAYKPL